MIKYSKKQVPSFIILLIILLLNCIVFSKCTIENIKDINVFDYYIDERVIDMIGEKNCNGTLYNEIGSCSSIHQALNYFINHESAFVNNFKINIHLNSDISHCDFRWKKEVNSQSELNVFSTEGRKSINCNAKLITIEVDGLLTVNLRNLNLNGVKFESGIAQTNSKFNLLNCKARTIIMDTNLCEYTITDSEIVDSSIKVNAFKLTNSKLNAVTFVANGLRTKTILLFSQIEASNCSFSHTKGTFTIEKSTITNSKFVSSVSEEISFEKSYFSNLTASVSFFSKFSISKPDLVDSPIPFYISAGEAFTLFSSNVLNSWGFNMHLVPNINVRKALFQNNKGALYMKQVSGIVIYESQFIDNTQGSLTILNEEVWKVRLFVITLSKFINNTSFGDGGAISIQSLLTEDVSLSVIGSTVFENNSAVNGGAIFSSLSSLHLQSVTFTNNRARCHNNLYCGRGGALMSPSSDGIAIEESTFNGNIALKGGALCISNIHKFIDNSFGNNSALLTGNDIYFTSKNILHLDRVSRLIIASKSLNSISVFSKEKLISEPIVIYPGQYISLKFKMIDLVNNVVTRIEKEPSVTTNSGNITANLYFNPDDLLEITSLQIFVDNEEEVQHSTPFTLSFFFDEFDAGIAVKMVVGKCPIGYILVKQPFGGFICENYLPIILSSIFGTVLIMCFLMSGTVVFWYITKRLLRLYKKERAEKKLQNKLLDKKFVFTDSNTSEELTETLLEHGARKRKQIKENSFIIPVEDISLEKRIGEGSNGVVYLATWSGFKVAVKSLKYESSLLDIDEEFEHEASLLANLAHPSIVRFYGIALGHTKYMIVEYLQNGSLDSVIAASRAGRKLLKMSQKLDILIGVSKGMNYLHSLRPMSTIHRDLKPGNILLDENYQPKVTDFGLSKLTSQHGSSTMTTNLGTMLYMAPELLSSEYEITSKLDVFSFAIIMYELLFEEPPYLSENKDKMKITLDINGKMNPYSIPLMVSKGARPYIPFRNYEEMTEWNKTFLKPRESYWNENLFGQVVDKYVDLMKQAWAQDPSSRPSFKDMTEILITIQSILSK